MKNHFIPNQHPELYNSNHLHDDRINQTSHLHKEPNQLWFWQMTNPKDHLKKTIKKKNWLSLDGKSPTPVNRCLDNMNKENIAFSNKLLKYNESHSITLLECSSLLLIL